MQDPTPYLRDLEVSVESAVNSRLQARIDDESLVRVNYEIYYVAEPREKQRFEGDPRKHCGFVTDPVTKQRFRPAASSPRRDFADQPWFFVSDSTEALFAAMPDSFLSPRYSMKPKS